MYRRWSMRAGCTRGSPENDTFSSFRARRDRVALQRQHASLSRARTANAALCGWRKVQQSRCDVPALKGAPVRAPLDPNAHIDVPTQTATSGRASASTRHIASAELLDAISTDSCFPALIYDRRPTLAMPALRRLGRARAALMSFRFASNIDSLRLHTAAPHRTRLE